MTYNLEDISFSEVIDAHGNTYAAFRKELSPQYSKIRKDIAKGYLALLSILIGSMILSRSEFSIWLLIPIGSFFTGYSLAYLHLFIHEAAHYNLSRKKSINDMMSDYMIGVFFGIPVNEYRKIHWLHHLHLGTTIDSEHSYFNAINPIFLLKVLSGLHSLSVIIFRSKIKRERNDKPTGWGYLVYMSSFHLAVVFLLFFFGRWVPVIIWFSGLLIVFPLLATIRQVLEHRSSNASEKVNYFKRDHGKVSRLFGDNIIETSFGSAGFNKHLIHHWDPVISYTRLKDVEIFLSNCPKTASTIKDSHSSYLKTLSSLFRLN